MDRVVDLDRAVELLAERTPRWQAAGLKAGRFTWRDGAAPWPQRLETDRSLVRDPDALGVRLRGPSDSELSVVLFRGGWADVDFMAGDDVGALPASGLVSADDFAVRLDQWVSRVFGDGGDGGAVGGACGGGHDGGPRGT